MSDDKNVDKTGTAQPDFLQPTSITFANDARPPIQNDPAFDFMFTGDSDVPFQTGASRRHPDPAK